MNQPFIRGHGYDPRGVDGDNRHNPRERTVRAAQEMKASGMSLYAIAVQLGVTKEWLREYAGLR